MINVFEYFDYHKYLRDSYEELHGDDPKFSYRYIQDKTGLDPGFLVKIFNGSKNLPETVIPKLSKLLKLNKRQSDYFTSMVLYGRAKSDLQKKNCFEKLLLSRNPATKTVDTDAYEFYSKWYYSAIRELLGVYSFKGDFEELSGLLVPAVNIAEAKKSVDLLERLGFIQKDVHGTYFQTDRFITCGHECKSMAVRAFQKETIMLAHDALDRIGKDSRDISSITTTLSPRSFSKIKEKIAEFRREILQIVNQEENASGVYQMNIQLFPISKQIQDNKE